MKVCDKCRKEIAKGKKVLEFELCEGCAKHIKEWIKKPAQSPGVLGALGSIMGGK